MPGRPTAHCMSHLDFTSIPEEEIHARNLFIVRTEKGIE